MFFKIPSAVTTLALVVYVIFLEGAQDLNILKLINASKISHSLKGSLEDSAAKCHNKSNQVGKGVLWSPQGLGDSGWDASVSALKTSGQVFFVGAGDSHRSDTEEGDKF